MTRISGFDILKRGGDKMIYTLTFNPAIDYVMHFEKFSCGKTNRSYCEYTTIGGKGINVSVVLNRLGIPSVAMGFVAGFTGAAIEQELKAEGVETDFVHLSEGISRINIKIKSGEETELNGKGPYIPECAVKEFFEQKLTRIKDGDALVIAGSVPDSLPKDIYSKILDEISNKNVRIVVDAEGELLLNSLKYKPFLIKPNHHELAGIFGKELENDQEIVACGKELQRKGAENVLVSMAEKGAILIDKTGNSYFCPAFKGEVINSVGAGDSMVAGFLAGLEKEGDFKFALKLGSAAGSATAFSKGLARKDDILSLLS